RLYLSIPGGTIMRCELGLSMLLSLSILGLASMTFTTDAPAQVACSGHIAAETATGVELQRRQTPDLPIARRRASRTRISRGCQPLCHTRHGEPRGCPRQQQRHPDLEGLFLAARRQWILCRQRKMVARLAILRLQHVVVRRPLALVISDDGIWPSEEP